MDSSVQKKFQFLYLEIIEFLKRKKGYSDGSSFLDMTLNTFQGLLHLVQIVSVPSNWMVIILMVLEDYFWHNNWLFHDVLSCSKLEYL